MPTYGYRCGRCGHELEVFQSMSAPRLLVCPECGGPLSKLLYPFGLQFKGSGFYSTDYKANGAGKKDGQKEAKSEPGAATEKASSSETKSEGAAAKE